MGVDFVFSKDGKSSMYISGDLWQWNQSVYYDGKKLWIHNFISNIALSSDGKSYSYIYTDDQFTEWPDPQNYYVVKDGKKSGPYKRVFSISYIGDTKEIGFIYEKDQKYFLSKSGKDVEIGKKSDGKIYMNNCFLKNEVKKEEIAGGYASYDSYNFWKYLYSPINSLSLYWVTKTWKKTVLINGQEITGYDEVYDIDVSDDGKTIGFVARKNNRLVIVRNGKEDFLEYSSWINNSKNANKWFQLSPDGKDYALKIGKNRKDILLINGKESEEFDTVASPRFYPDKIIFYWEKDGKKYTVFSDGKKVEDPEQKNFSQMYYSPDGKRVITVASDQPWKYKVTVDGGISRSLDSYPIPKFSHDSKSYAFVSEYKGYYSIFKDGVGGDVGTYLSPIENENMKFSPDSKNFAYLVQNTFNGVIIKDGKEVSTTDKLIKEFTFCGKENKIYYRLWMKGEIYEEGNIRPIYTIDQKKYPGGIDNLACINNELFFTLSSQERTFLVKNFIIDESRSYDRVNGIHSIGDNKDYILYAEKGGKFLVVNSKVGNISPVPDNTRNVWLAVKIDKIRKVLEQLAKGNQKREKALYDKLFQIIDQMTVDDTRPELLLIEGELWRMYQGKFGK